MLAGPVLLPRAGTGPASHASGAVGGDAEGGSCRLVRRVVRAGPVRSPACCGYPGWAGGPGWRGGLCSPSAGRAVPAAAAGHPFMRSKGGQSCCCPRWSS